MEDARQFQGSEAGIAGRRSVSVRTTRGLSGATMSRYADLSTDELDRLIALEERRMDRERGVKKDKDRCALLHYQT